MLAGEWPSKDFVDPGTPLMYAVSAAARLAVDSPLLAEALVVSTAFAAAAALTVYAAFLASGSLALATAVTLAQVAMFPRSYHYPKLLFYALGILAIWGYLASPSRRRAGMLAACLAVAFLFRHDHGVILGAAALAAAGVSGNTWRERAGRILELLTLAAVCVLPYLIFLAATSGVAEHFASGLEYSRAEADRTTIGLPPFDAASPASSDNARVALFYLFHLLPVLVVAAPDRRMIPVAILAIAANVTMLRDPLQARLPDVSVPACVLAAWLISRSGRLQGFARVAARALIGVAAVIALIGVTVVGRPLEQLNRSGLLLSPRRWPSIARERVVELQAPFASRQLPSQYIEDMAPFLEYVRRCTNPEQRLFVAGEAAEIYVYTRRLFAGGQPMLRKGFFGTVADQQRLVRTLRDQDVPLVIVLSEGDAALYPIVMEEVNARYEEVAAIPIEGQGTAMIRVRNGLQPRRVDAATGLPCFT